MSPDDVAIHVASPAAPFSTVTVLNGAPGESWVEFMGEIPLGTAVGETFSEEALFTDAVSDIMIARKTFDAFVKGSYILRFTHRLVY